METVCPKSDSSGSKPTATGCLLAADSLGEAHFISNYVLVKQSSVALPTVRILVLLYGNVCSRANNPKLSLKLLGRSKYIQGTVHLILKQMS